MARLPFDPDKLPEREVGPPAHRKRARAASADTGAPPGADPPRPLSVSDVSKLIKNAVANATPTPIRVVGEVSNLSDRRHWYLSLKDEKDVLSCVMWASANRRCQFKPERGQQVVATGRLDYYGPQGRLQLYIDSLEPVGQGALELRLRQLCEQLRNQGYFDDAHKLPPRAFPQHIAVVTSRGGAALHDVINTARHRWPGIKLSLLDVRVQGAGAAAEIARALNALSQHHQRLNIDAVILTRGGGSLEDLWAFNERVVADAIFNADVFIAAAVGHETDTTVAELVADLRCSTPTQAAARLVPDAAAEKHRTQQYAHRLATSLRRRLEHDRSRFQAVANHPVFRRPDQILQRRQQLLHHLEHRLGSALRSRLADARDRLHGLRHQLTCLDPGTQARLARRELTDARRRLDHALQHQLATRRQAIDAAQRQLRAVGPQSVLARGYGYTTDENGQIVRSVKQVHPGQTVRTHLADGHFYSTVNDNDTPTPSPPKKQPRPKSTKKQKPTPTHPNLFENL